MFTSTDLFAIAYGVLSLASFNAYYRVKLRPWTNVNYLAAESTLVGLLFPYFIPHFLLMKLYDR